MGHESLKSVSRLVKSLDGSKPRDAERTPPFEGFKMESSDSKRWSRKLRKRTANWKAQHGRPFRSRLKEASPCFAPVSLFAVSPAVTDIWQMTRCQSERKTCSNPNLSTPGTFTLHTMLFLGNSIPLVEYSTPIGSTNIWSLRSCRNGRLITQLCQVSSQ